jgi:hypothetical protein
MFFEDFPAILRVFTRAKPTRTRFEAGYRLAGVGIFLLFLLISPWAKAEATYQIKPLSEKETLEMYTSLMRDACHHADQFWTNWTVDPRGGMWGTGRSDNMNEGIRAISEMVLTCGALLKYSDALTEQERQEYTRKSIAAIRYAVASHRSGTQKCTDGKPWGGSWQSAMWTGTLGLGAWLIWDKLDTGLRQELERVLASESDRFLNVKPPGKEPGDTKAEENGWNMICLSVSANMFPQNPHAAAWNEKGLEYMMNTLSAPQDRHDSSMVDGRPVSQWFSGPNVNADFTLENHGIFHPSYVACSSYFLTEAAMHYTLAGRAIPQAAAHHLMDTWRMFQGLILPTAESAYPQGMDWELHGLTFINLFASLATWQKDPLAARMEKISLQYMRAWQAMAHGDLAVPGSRLGLTRHASCAEQATYGFLAHKIFGPPVQEMPVAEAVARVEGTRASDAVQFITHRTAHKLASFSWTNRVMGLVMPIGRARKGGAIFTVPIADGLIGSFDLKPAGKAAPKVIEHTWKENPNGFETTGVVLSYDGRLKETIRVTSIGESTVVYQDRVIALTNVTVTRELGVPVGIENDMVSGGTRVLSDQNGHTNFDWRKPQPRMTISNSWANVDGHLGIAAVSGSGLAYAQASRYGPISVYSDTLYGSFNDHAREFKAGEQAASRIAILSVEVTPDETAALSHSARIEETKSGRILIFRLPEGGEARIPLL